MARIFLAALGVFLLGAASAPPYSIQAIRLADSPGDAVAEMVIGAPQDEKIDTVYALWLIRGGGHNILFDSGFHRARWFKEWVIKDYLSPGEAVRLAGVKPEEVTDVVISHAHWDHMGGIDLFPKATVWIQAEEFRYYTGPAWQPGGDHEGIDPEDVVELVRLNTEGRLHLIDGDNVYLYRNLTEHRPSATFSEADYPANLANQQRMILLAGGSMERVIPGHDALQFQKYPTVGRIANIH
jgi:glyoxylase-like metal-dependent hydrolase (beta-lactamase superfamily II)